MAQCKLTPREFIGNTFSPQIAAVCSVNAEATCQKNNLSFVELLQPFCKLNTEGHIKDPQGSSVTIRNFRLSIQDINIATPEPSIARKLLNESVSSATCEHTTTVQVGTTDLVIPLSVPWFEAWRETFLAVQAASDHEFTKRFLACMLVISTAEDNPLEKIQNMGIQLYQGIPGKSPKWFNNNTLRYYVLVHDSLQDDKDKAEKVFTEMKNIYGPNNCFLLQMNSRPPRQAEENIHLPDPWSQFLTKFTDLSGSTEQNSSPRTPADTAALSSMPNEVTTESDKFSHAETPVESQTYTALTPEDRISLSSNSGQLEVGQEAVPVKMHPLSPHQNAKSIHLDPKGNLKNQLVNDSPINENVWADSPSRPLTQHGTRLSTQDLEGLRSLITEFSLKSLLPYVEKQIALLNDVISNKKGVSRSLFSATKRWFGTNKPGIPSTAPVNTVIYSGESPELQLRRLGDLCFMFGHYSLAYQAYHSVKRDFASDQAWLYYAGALEMAALSAFMQGEMNRKTVEYMDDAILTYLNSCKMPQFATRATLLSVECLKGRGLYGEAAKQLIRMTSEDSDLRSALLLEQAAYSFINPKMMRKYAFHAVLAGHRFSKAGQKRHSLRCYQQAYQVYNNKGWSLAEDHIHFTIGRQAASLKQLHEAVEAFEKLLSITSKQPAPQQAAFLREFLHTHSLLLEEIGDDRRELPVLPLPIVDGNNIKVLFGHLVKSDGTNVPAKHVSFDDNDTDDVRWWKMEETLLTEVQGSTMIFRPTVALYSRTSNNTTKPYGVVDEPVHFNIEMYNPLHIPLTLFDVTLLSSFHNDCEVITNERSCNFMSGPVEAHVIETITLQPACKQNVVVSLTPKLVGELKVLGLTYRLSGPSQQTVDRSTGSSSTAISGKTLFTVQGPKLKNTKEKPRVSVYGMDHRLEMTVIEKAPFLQVHFSAISSEVLCGEIQEVRITLKNIGNAPLTNVHVTCTDPKLCSLGDRELSQNRASGKTKAAVMKIPLPPTAEGTLNIGETHAFSLWLQAPYEKGSHRIDLLFYYESVGRKSVPRHRLCRHSWHLAVTESIHLRTCASKSALFNEESSTLNLVMRVKNASQTHDHVTNEIYLTHVFLRSEFWAILASSDLPYKVNIKPQEEYHLLLKLKAKAVGDTNITSVILSEKSQVDETADTNAPLLSFVEKKNSSFVNANESLLDSQLHQQQPSQHDQHGTEGDAELNTVSSGMMLNSTLILDWQAKITGTGGLVRRARGQHYLDMEFLNTTYEHPREKLMDQSSYGERLMVFGPDRNVPGSPMATVSQQQISELECRKNIVSFTLNHDREVTHRFGRNRFCTVPVLMFVQNYLSLSIDVKINTIGSSSQAQLPNIKSQMYSAQASTYFRYARHTAIFCHIEPLERQQIKLYAILPAPGTYDLAARIQVLARVASGNNNVNTAEYLPQKWKIESICIINDDAPQ